MSALQDAIQSLSKFPFLLELGPRHYLVLLFDAGGSIRWNLSPERFDWHNEMLGHLEGKSIGEFYDIPPDALHPGSKTPDLSTVESHYTGRDPNGVPSVLDNLPAFPSKNVFENRFEGYSLTSSLPLSSLRVLRVVPDVFLGIVFFYHRLKEPSQWPNDLNCILDDGDRLVAFDENFSRALGGKKPALGQTLQEDIDTGFLSQKPSFTRLPGRGEAIFEFPGKAFPTLEFNDHRFFKARPRGIAVTTEGQKMPALARLPIPLDLVNSDYRIHLEFDLDRGEPPFLILNADPLEGGAFPDEYGILIGPYVRGGNSKGLEKEGLPFIIKKSGRPAAFFKALPPRPGKKGRPSDYALLKKGGELAFFLNGKPVGRYFDDDLGVPPERRGLVIGLRGGANACVLKKFEVFRYPSEPGEAPRSPYATYFLNRPEKLFKVNAQLFLMDQPRVPGRVYKYLRLEDLSVREQLKGLMIEKERQRNEIERLRLALRERKGLNRIIGQSREMESIKKTLATVARSTAPLLLYGETGTGKSLIAQSIHELSGRRGPLVVVDCSTLPETLIEAELFGFEKGAFTGALARHLGKFEQAHRGTLFLDEIANLSAAVQAKLLVALQNLSVQRVGGTAPVSVDIRLITATHGNLEVLVREGAFREDLFYRLNVLQLKVPSLKERLDDIPLLCEHWMAEELPKHAPAVKTISKAAVKKLMQYPWPGNIRELYNTLVKSAVMCEGAEVRPEDIRLPGAVAASGPGVPLPESGGRRRARKYSLERITEAVRECHGNIQWAADHLGIARNTVYYRLKKAEETPPGR